MFDNNEMYGTTLGVSHKIPLSYNFASGSENALAYDSIFVFEGSKHFYRSKMTPSFLASILISSTA